MTDPRHVKSLLYEQVARIGKAVASPKRLELIDLLCQSEKTVESLAQQGGLSVKLASAHLKELKAAHIVESRKHGKYVYYRLAGEGVCSFWVALRSLAEERLLELKLVLKQFVADPAHLAPLDRKAVLGKARKGEIVMLDVRPGDEYETGHLPYARSLPLGELKKRLAELPKDREIVAYCRGPFCMMAVEAVALLRRKGFRAARLQDGVADWTVAGLPLESSERRGAEPSPRRARIALHG